MIRLALRLAVLALLAAGPAAVEVAAQTQQRAFGAWQGGLTPAGLGWVATTEKGKAAGTLARFELLRSGAPDAPWHAVVVTPVSLDRHKPLRLDLDGRSYPIPPGEMVARDAPEALTIQHGETLGALQAGLRTAKTLRIAGSDRNGSPVESEFSLAGLSAAMLWLDERQARVGKPQRFAPIAKPSGGPFYAPKRDGAPPGEPGEIISVALPSRDTWPEDLRDLEPAILERHLMLGSCEEPDFAGARGRFWTARLDPWTTVYGVSCARGAYNVFDRLYAVSGGDFRNLQPLTFAEPDGVDGWDATDVLANAGVDERTGTLTAFNKGRGAADCGTIGTWAWTGQKFSLREYRAEAQCNGRPPEAWAVLFRARPR